MGRRLEVLIKWIGARFGDLDRGDRPARGLQATASVSGEQAQTSSPSCPRPAVLTAPSGEQIEIVHGDQRAVVMEVGGGLRTYSAAQQVFLHPRPGLPFSLVIRIEHALCLDDGLRVLDPTGAASPSAAETRFR